MFTPQMFWPDKKLTLVIDAGNTNVVFALWDGTAKENNWVGEFRHETNLRTTADDLAVWLGPLLQLDGKGLGQIGKTVIASVVPGLDYALRAFVRKYLKIEPVFITASLPLPFHVKLPHPEQLGADRLCNTAAVMGHYPCPAIVIDLGTATTFDVMDADGNYVGGVIAPGPQASLRALTEAAAKLPSIHISRPQCAMGTDTVGAMQSGLFWGYVGLINGILAQLQQEQGAAKSIIATGGLANLFKDHIHGLTAVDMTITLRGALALSQQR
jgi:type III pantothenate kinase